MTDYRYANRDRGSIFPDDDRAPSQREPDRWRREDYGWGGDPSRVRDRQTTDDRGFLERAGDEVRSWFGDEDAERRRERDGRRDEADRGSTGYRRSGFDDQTRDRSAARTQPRSNAATAGHGDDDYGRGGFGDGGFGGTRREQGFAGHHDEAYRRWREQQIAQLDSEYDEYRRHRQSQFEQDFTSFRQNRQSGITSGGPTLGAAGDSGAISAQQTAGTADPASTDLTVESGEAFAGTDGKAKRG